MAFGLAVTKTLANTGVKVLTNQRGKQMAKLTAKLSNNGLVNLFCNAGQYNGNCQRKAKLWANLPPQCRCGKFVKRNSPIFASSYGHGNWYVGVHCKHCLTVPNTVGRYCIVNTCNCCGKFVRGYKIVGKLALPIPLAKALKSKNPNIIRALGAYYHNLAKYGPNP